MSEASETVDGRESTYGHPWGDFTTVQALMRIWEKRHASVEPDPNSVMDPDYEACVKHVVYMIFVKLTRLSKSPSHYDSILDLGGYAETLMRCYKRAFDKDTAKLPKTWTPPPGFVHESNTPQFPDSITRWDTKAFERPSDEEIRKACDRMMGKVPMDLPDPGDSFTVEFNKRGHVPGDTFIGGPNAEEVSFVGREFGGLAPTPP